MSRCNSCSAPLLANTNRCRYCNTRNDVDLHALHSHSTPRSESERICPECNKAMQTIDLKIDGELLIEHCNQCYGLFFDPGEIEKLLEHSVSNVFGVNFKHLLNINKDRYQRKKIKYVPCPVCQVLMNRVNFGRRSGVVIDHCRKHGVWLDSGELTHLLEWKKAGGQLLDKQSDRQSNKKRKRNLESFQNNHSTNSIFSQNHRSSSASELIESVASVIFKLFN